MTAYRDYRVSLKLLAPLGTPLQSDTLFGHLCWQVAYGRWSGGDVDAFLAPFHAGAPPFVLSDGFPAGLLPKPMAWRPPHLDVPDREINAQTKSAGKARFVVEDDFRRICRGEMPSGEPVRKAWTTIETLHASLDRNTGTTGAPGSLFQTSAWVPCDQKGEACDRVDLYVRCREGWIETVEAFLREVAKTGYGKDKSVGLGAFRVERVEPYSGFDLPKGADGFVSLSSLVPAASDPTDGVYRLRTKFGKSSEIVPSGNPFKRPLLQMEPGACFKTGGTPHPWYGRMVPGIAPADERVVQCGLTLAVGLKWSAT